MEKEERITIGSLMLAFMFRCMNAVHLRDTHLCIFSAEKIIYFLKRFGADDIFTDDFHDGENGVISGTAYEYMGISTYMKPDSTTDIFEDLEMFRYSYGADEILKNIWGKKYLDICTNVSKLLCDRYSNAFLDIMSETDYIIEHEQQENTSWKTLKNCTIRSRFLRKSMKRWKKEYGYKEDKYVRIDVDNAINQLKSFNI